MSEFRISEMAERSGFAASALRFYEQIGLLPQPARSAGGYRLYGEATVERLRFIASGKRLGLPLEEIQELIRVWDGGSCAPVQERLRPLLAEKVAEVDARVAELSALSAQLTGALAELGRYTPAGPCDEDCGCLTSGDAAVVLVPVAMEWSSSPPSTPAEPPQPGSSGGDEPIVCTLSAVEQPPRAREWSQLVGSASSQEEITGGQRLRFPADPVLAGQIAELAAREQQCCRFFDFRLSLSPQAILVEVRAPSGAEDLIRALLEQALVVAGGTAPSDGTTDG